MVCPSLQGASRTAPEASQVKQDAAALAAAEKLLAACGASPPPDEQTRKNTVITCRRMLLELASIKVTLLLFQAYICSQSCNILSFSAVFASRESVPWTLLVVDPRLCPHNDAQVQSPSSVTHDTYAYKRSPLCSTVCSQINSACWCCLCINGFITLCSAV